MGKVKRTINRRTMFAEIHQDTRENGKPHVFSLKYCKVDATVGEKDQVCKSVRNAPGAAKFRQNVNLNHILLLQNLENNTVFELHIDLLLEYNGMRINHQY
ncbi:hypothetical protein [Spirosoma oryzicola]|uniref:hypothetical protein n=1 Tax=Spirosoma oryzicola TaxID=2898794 RepID=UPI001E4C29EF|nr:hypothetical protein [Spirosoma oryzicola]UHG90098.1 hypothetical protein LQ777_17820 [Spirosoma oryzicola]